MTPLLAPQAQRVAAAHAPGCSKPRPVDATSIPALLSLVQNEWDAFVLESFELKKHLHQARQELSHALYQ